MGIFAVIVALLAIIEYLSPRKLILANKASVSIRELKYPRK